jgi:predicted dithiol-disulfide oxidoreductase (DUF899 family)
MRLGTLQCSGNRATLSRGPATFARQHIDVSLGMWQVGTTGGNRDDYDAGDRFPAETGTYRAARAQLLEAEKGLRRQLEEVATLRRKLPLGGGGEIPRTTSSRKVIATWQTTDPRARCECRRDGRIHHFYNTELLYHAPDPGQDQRHVDLIWPLWSLFDLTPEGRSKG